MSVFNELQHEMVALGDKGFCDGTEYGLQMARQVLDACTNIDQARDALAIVTINARKTLSAPLSTGEETCR